MDLKALFSFVFSKDKKTSQYIRNIFGYYPRNVYLYQLAGRHKSASKVFVNGLKLCNERLEYLGDAVLSSIIADYLFKKFPYKEEGFLTEMRSRVVSRVQLNKLSRKLGIDKMIESGDSCSNFSKSLYGNAFEAYVGALYLDKGYDFTKRVIIKRVIEVHVDMDKIEQQEMNFKSQLIEWSQKEKIPVEFKVINETGNGYHKLYHVELTIDNEVYSEGQDYSIKGAEQMAAGNAIEKLELRKE